MRSFPRRIVTLGAFAPLATVLLAGSGCNTFQGARLYHEGSEALARGDTAAAVEALERAARLVPRASEVQNHLGLAYQAQGRTDEARRAFARALELDCGNEAARRNLRGSGVSPGP